MNEILFLSNGIGLRKIDGKNDNFTEIISYGKARKIANAFDLCCAMDDVHSHLALRYGREFIDEKGAYVYNRKKIY